MHPGLTTVHVGARERPIASYGVLLSCALMVGALGTLHAARQPSGHGQAIELGALISALGLAISFGFAGAWAVHAMAQVLRSGSLSAAWSQPGISVLGALLGGAAAVIWSARALNFSALQLLDRAVPWVALAQAIGRIGCLLGGCCYGAASRAPWALRYPAPDVLGEAVVRSPVPLFEALALVGLACLFGRMPAPLARRLSAPGARAASYLALYALVRLLLEPLRADAVRGVYLGGWVSTAQLLAVLVLAGALGFLRLALVPTKQRS